MQVLFANYVFRFNQTKSPRDAAIDEIEDQLRRKVHLAIIPQAVGYEMIDMCTELAIIISHPTSRSGIIIIVLLKTIKRCCLILLILHFKNNQKTI